MLQIFILRMVRLMKINLVSFSDFDSVLDIYDKEKMDLFSFMLVKIIEKGGSKSIKEVLYDLNINDNLMYLYQNNFYFLLDNQLIVNDNKSDDISFIKVNEVKLSEFGKYCLANNYIPRYRESRELRVIYNVLDGKLVSDNKVNESSNVVVVDDKVDFLKLINDNKKGLINEYNDTFVLNYKSKEANPYFYEMNVSVSELDEKLKRYLKDNKVLLGDNKVIDEDKSEFLSSNFKCKLVYCDKNNMVNSDYYLICLEEKKFEVEGNKIYIDSISEFSDYSFVSLGSEVMGYKVSRIKVDDTYCSAFSKNKLKDNMGDIKKYLVKNKDKFKDVRVINEVIDLL